MIKIRFGVFETNSSSTHVMVLSPETPIFKDFLDGKAFLVNSCPSWLEKHLITSGSGWFIRISDLYKIIREQPKKVQESFENFIHDYEEERDDTENLMQRVNHADLGREYIHVYDYSTFSDGSEIRIEVNGTPVIAIGAEIYDE